MISSKVSRGVLCALLFAIVCFGGGNAFAQESEQAARPAATARDADANLDTQLYLILATNRDSIDGKMPLALEPVMAQVRETLGFKHYALAASFLNRVGHNGRLEMTWVGGPLLAPTSSPMGNPSFNQFAAMVKVLRMKKDASWCA